MASKWYCTQHRIKYGPVSGADLKALAQSGKLLPTDLVWKEGMSKWKRAEKARGLFLSAPQAAPPPTPTSQPATPDLASAAKGFLGASATAKKTAAKVMETAKDAQTKSQDQIAKILEGINRASGLPSASGPKAGALPRKRRSLIELLLVGGVLSVCALVMIVVTDVFLLIRSDDTMSPIRGGEGHQKHQTKNAQLAGAQFNPKDFQESLAWVKSIQKRIEGLDNPLLLKEGIERESQEFEKVNGTSVEWQFPVTSLGSRGGTPLRRI